jgi:hypothetical protein
MTEIPHFAVPFNFVGTTVAAVEQDTPEEVTQCVYVIAHYHPGDRAELPEFGIPDQVFRPLTDVDLIRDAVERWEPRSSVALSSDFDLASLVDSVRLNVEVQQ